jgi:hypothetical protein
MRRHLPAHPLGALTPPQVPVRADGRSAATARYRSRLAGSLFLVAAALCPPSSAQGTKKTELVRVRSLPLASEERALDAAWRDVDGDGAKDLCFALGPRASGARRSLVCHRQLSSGALDPKAHFRIELAQDVVAFPPRGWNSPC